MRGDFSYSQVQDGAGLQLGVTIIADGDAVREKMREDAATAGFRVLDCCELDEFASGIGPLGDLILVDCHAVDAQTLAMLSRLDMRAGKSGAQVIVSTSLDTLDAVFGCLSMSGAEILVSPSRAQRVVAIGRVLAEGPNLRLREMAEEDRLVIARLTEQVSRLAQRMEDSATGVRRTGTAFRYDSTGAARNAANGDCKASIQGTSPGLPGASVIRGLIRQRQLRARFFDAELFADPAWDVLLDLSAARVEGKRVSVTSLCIASGVPATTALRWIGQMVDSGLLLRVPDANDGRRAYIALSDEAADGMARYFAEVGVSDKLSEAAA